MFLHPGITEEPSRDPDFREYAQEAWFDEMVYAYRRSSGEYDICPMMVCPRTDVLMYMPLCYPLQWQEIKNKDLKEMHLRYIVEKNLLR